MKTLKHKYKIGDVFENQGSRLIVMRLLETTSTDPAKEPIYEVRSPYTRGDNWLMGEGWLLTLKKLRAGAKLYRK